MTSKLALTTPLTPRKRGIVVGALGGIGTAVAKKLAKEGYALALTGRDKKALQALCNEINKEAGDTRVKGYPHDLMQTETVPALLKTMIADLGGIDTIIIVAGTIYFPKLDEFNFKEDAKMVQVNTIGAIAWLTEIAPLFLSMKGGQIVGIASVAADRGRVGNPGYNASKAAFSSYMESMRNRLTRHGVNVLTIKPGFVKTNMLAGVKKAPFAISAEASADLIYKAMRSGRKQVVYVPGIWRWIMLVIRHIPSFIFRRLNF